MRPGADDWREDPYGEDTQLALYCCYELHYRGFDGVPEGLEWDPELLGVCHAVERAFLSALRRDVRGGDDLSLIHISEPTRPY